MGNELKLRKQNQINRVNIFTLPGDGYKIKDELEFLFLHSLYAPKKKIKLGRVYVGF